MSPFRDQLIMDMKKSSDMDASGVVRLVVMARVERHPFHLLSRSGSEVGLGGYRPRPVSVARIYRI